MWANLVSSHWYHLWNGICNYLTYQNKVSEFISQIYSASSFSVWIILSDKIANLKYSSQGSLLNSAEIIILELSPSAAFTTACCSGSKEVGVPLMFYPSMIPAETLDCQRLSGSSSLLCSLVLNSSLILGSPGLYSTSYSMKEPGWEAPPGCWYRSASGTQNVSAPPSDVFPSPYSSSSTPSSSFSASSTTIFQYSSPLSFCLLSGSSPSSLGSPVVL